MPQSQNSFLASLSEHDFSVIQPYLKPVELVHQDTLYRTGQPLDRVYFPKSAVISLVVGLASGQMAEIAMVGHDGLVGGSAGLGMKVSLNEATVQLPGSAFLLDAATLKAAADNHPSFREALFRREQLVLLQAQQSAACNVNHQIEKRLARWLLRSHDLAMTESLLLTQEFLSQMLGVRRTSVTLIAQTLQRSGLIKYRRGNIRILDAVGLAELACECHEAIRAHSKALLGINTPAEPAPGSGVL
jgi:CRP-like cAMP-binding protein